MIESFLSNKNTNINKYLSNNNKYLLKKINSFELADNMLKMNKKDRAKNK